MLVLSVRDLRTEERYLNDRSDFALVSSMRAGDVWTVLKNESSTSFEATRILRATTLGSRATYEIGWSGTITVHAVTLSRIGHGRWWSRWNCPF
jgi:hypothetical protein